MSKNIFDVICTTCSGFQKVKVQGATAAWKCPHCGDILRAKAVDLRHGKANRVQGLIG